MKRRGIHLFMGALLLGSAADLSAAEKWSAPNGQMVCFSRLGRRSKGEEMWIRLRSAPETQLLWASDSRLEAAWSPDSRFVAVTDHYDGKHHAVLVFGLAFDTAKGTLATALLFQTPLPEDREVSWQLLGWDLKKGKIILGKTEGRRKTVVDGFLSGDLIEQDLYSVDPRHWIPEQNQQKPDEKNGSWRAN
jgi:hypothetical protein